MEKKHEILTPRKHQRRAGDRPQRRSKVELTRRLFLAMLLLLLLAVNAAAEASRPILFIHGNGDSAALWHTTIWRFESNGYDSSLLCAIDFKHPAARNDDTKPQENRSSTADQLRELAAKPAAYYEFVVTADGYPITHIYRTPFPRSSAYIHLRLKPLSDREKGSGALVTLIRPRGYLGHGRDTFLIDGKVPPGVNEGVPGTAEGKMRFEPGPLRPVRVVLNQEAMTVLPHPLEAGHIVIAEFHY